MLNVNNICVVGGGNLGVALAVDISQRKNVTLLTSKASPCDGAAFQERLKEELRALIAVSFINTFLINSM